MTKAKTIATEIYRDIDHIIEEEIAVTPSDIFGENTSLSLSEITTRVEEQKNLIAEVKKELSALLTSTPTAQPTPTPEPELLHFGIEITPKEKEQIAETLISEPQAKPANTPNHKLSEDAIKSIIDWLKPEQREAVYSYNKQGLQPAEISQCTHITEDVIEYLLQEQEEV